MNKLYVIKLGLDIFHLEEIYYSDLQDMISKTKGIPDKYIFTDLDKATDMISLLNGI